MADEKKPVVENAAKKTARLAPLFAVNKIVYGDNKKAPAKSVFTPTNAKERDELLDLGAARELDDDEAKLFKADAASDDEIA